MPHNVEDHMIFLATKTVFGGCGFRQMMAGAAARIQIFLLYSARIAAVIFKASLLGALFAVGLPATKGTTQVIPAGITWMGEKQNPAVPAANQTLSQLRLGF